MAPSQLVDENGHEAADGRGIAPEGVERDGVEARELGLGFVQLDGGLDLRRADQARFFRDEWHEPVEDAADIGAQELGVGARQDPLAQGEEAVRLLGSWHDLRGW